MRSDAGTPSEGLSSEVRVDLARQPCVDLEVLAHLARQRLDRPLSAQVFGLRALALAFKLFAAQMVSVSLSRLGEQDQRRGVGCLRREGQVEKDERATGPNGGRRLRH